MLRGTGSKCGNGLSFYALPAVLSLFYGILRESFEWFVNVHFAGTLSSLEKIKQYYMKEGDRGNTVVKVLCYKSEGRWFDSRWCSWNFSLT